MLKGKKLLITGGTGSFGNAVAAITAGGNGLRKTGKDVGRENMGRKQRPKMEYRYYKMPTGSPILALLGTKWIQIYGQGIDYLHFHNYLEIGYCYSGNGILTLGKQDIRFQGGEFTIIPKKLSTYDE